MRFCITDLFGRGVRLTNAPGTVFLSVDGRDGIRRAHYVGPGVLRIARARVRCTSVGKRLIVELIVRRGIVAHECDRGVAWAAGDRRERNIDDIITEAATIRPPGRNLVSIFIRHRISADEAEPAEAGFTRDSDWAGGGIDPNNVRYVDGL